MSTPSALGSLPTEQRSASSSTSGVWRVEGPLTVYTVADARDILLEQLRMARELELNLAAVVACDCAGLQMLCAAHKSARQAGKVLRVVNCSPAVASAALEIGLAPEEFAASSSTL